MPESVEQRILREMPELARELGTPKQIDRFRARAIEAEAALERAYTELREIVRVYEAWRNDEYDVGLTTDEEQNFDADMDFVRYMGQTARKALPDEGDLTP